MILCREPYAKAIDKAVFPGIQGGPLMHVIAAKAVAFKEALQPEFAVYQRQILQNAQALAEALLAEGMNLVSGGTDNHLMLVDLRSLGITGKKAEKVLDAVNITVNKNAIPFDPESPNVTSGIRIGTPALTSRGFTEDDMRVTARLIHTALTHADDAETLVKVKAGVQELCASHPLYGNLENLD
jgi:glycine hydroxymethyltransferase